MIFEDGYCIIWSVVDRFKLYPIAHFAKRLEAEKYMERRRDAKRLFVHKTRVYEDLEAQVAFKYPGRHS